MYEDLRGRLPGVRCRRWKRLAIRELDHPLRDFNRQRRKANHAGSTNRSFIQHALENVAKAIKDDDTVEIEPVIDGDTQGVPGAPDISKTIFQEIAEADVVIADVSIINGGRRGRPTPNPNG